MKKAFTMLELVMVIIVLGIVASIGADIIVALYDNYIRARTINALESKTEITLEQIAKRFQYRIKSSTIARQVGGNFISVSSPLLDNSYPIIEWIGYSNESFLGTPRPGWSGFIDMFHSDTNSTSQTFRTSDSNLALASNVISALTSGDINLTAGNEAALIFKKPWNIGDFGWGTANNTDGNATVKVRILNDEVLVLSNDTNLTEIYEQYYLAHTAYAIVPEGDIANEDFNLTLYYNYQPWMGEEYNNNGSRFPLVEHANLFHFRQDQTLLRFKLCIHDNNESGIGERVVVCKEKVVY
jgi:prepilin-type N-terminal cleavage/methylation domain-containing protein